MSGIVYFSTPRHCFLILVQVNLQLVGVRLQIKSCKSTEVRTNIILSPDAMMWLLIPGCVESSL
jgi:hypothetical protein